MQHFVEFDVPVGSLQSIGGLKGATGLGRFQQFVPDSVSLSGANATFGTLAPNRGRFVFYGGLGVGVGATGYGIYTAVTE